jgi:hypothetical protein
VDVEIVGSSEAAARRWRCDGALFVMPFTDPVQARRAALLMARRAGAPGLVLAVHDDDREGFIRIANRVFASSASAFFGYVAQDAYPGRYWLRNALTVLANPSTQLVAFNDGKWFGALAGYGLVRRSWAGSLYGGPLFCPQYVRHYADAELSVIALEQDALGYAADGVLVEVDWDKDARPVEQRDRQLFRSRARAGFDGKVKTKELQDRFS